MNDPYQTLEVPRDASGEQIKQAHRKRAKATHPDRTGGDEEEFKAVTAAYSLLSNPEARAHYDRTGQAPLPEQRISPAEQLIINTLTGTVIASGDLEDVLGTLQREIGRKLASHRENLSAATVGELAAREQLGRFRIRGEQSPDGNLLEGAFQNLVANAQRVQATQQEAIRIHEEALEMLKGYEDTRPPEPELDPYDVGVYGGPESYGGFFFRGGRDPEIRKGGY